MVVLRDPGEVYLLRHTAGDGAISFVERIDAETLEPLGRSADLAAGPVWPGSVAVHANGSLYVVFGNHAHRLSPDLDLIASAELPRQAPYNGFVVLADGSLATKDFSGSRPGHVVAAADRRPSELVVLEPVGLEITARLELAEPSIARLSALRDDVYVVGTTSLLRVHHEASSGLTLDEDFRAPYRHLDGQTYGWDCVLAGGAAWFLDDGDGSEAYSGTLRGHGVSTAPLHLIRVDLATGVTTTAEVCGLPGGLVANPPAIDVERGIAVGYDSGNGVMTAFDVAPDGTFAPRWSSRRDHAAHPLLFPRTGELLTGDFDGERGVEEAVVLDVSTGAELARVPTGSPVQSVLFPSVGHGRDAYWCTFTTVSHLAMTGRAAGGSTGRLPGDADGPAR